MPSAAARRTYEDQIPTFMSVFDLDSETIAGCEIVTLINPKMVDLDSSKSPVLAPPSAPRDVISPEHTHRHHDSNSSQMSTSTDSSPTTLSTTDSSPLTDGSPSPSPDSPIHLIPLNNYPGTSFDAGLPPATTLPMLPIPEATVFQRPMTSPAPRRPRNMKGLSIHPPSAVTATTQALGEEPGTPSFIKPTIQGMKRKPSLLSLKTNTSDLMLRPAALEVPASPGMPPILQRRALKHSTSSPHMLSTLLTSTTITEVVPPLPKMLERNESGLSDFLRPMKTGVKASFDDVVKEEEDSPIRTQVAKFAEYEPYDESVNNEDQKSPSYPEGPVAIYGDNVYLYLEPTAVEASKFDVVFNVAREVKDPFDTTTASSTPHSQKPDFSPIPDTAVTACSFSTAFEYQPSEEGTVDTPTTPRANPLKKPEYIHIPWDHNTDIAPDLMELCEKIDNRTKEGKKVLIHCQQGASRSASLIIAYGLYQNPALGVNDAYYAAQSKSKWISPNMKLMYSLQDFQKEISRRRSPPSAYRPRTGRSPTKHRLTLSADSIQVSADEPKTAPLPTNEQRCRDRLGGESPTRPRGHSTPDLPISAGPASAPLSSSWRDLNTGSDQQAEPVVVPPEPTWAPPPEPSQSQSQPQSLFFPSPPPPPTRAPPPPPVPFSPLPMGGESLQRPKTGYGRPEYGSRGRSELCIKTQLSAPRARSSIGLRSLPLRSIEEQSPIDGRSETVVSFVTSRVAVPLPALSDLDALMSPRAETMTTKPLWASNDMAGMRFVESPPTPSAGLFSPRVGMFPKDPFSSFVRPIPVTDPRSPPTKGEAQIIRSIDDIL